MSPRSLSSAGRRLRTATRAVLVGAALSAAVGAAAYPSPAGAAGAVLRGKSRPSLPVPPVDVPAPAVGAIPVAPPPPAEATGTEARHPGPAYWLVGGDGGVFPFGRGAFEGGLATRSTNAPVIAAAVTRSGLGYWLAASDGGVFAFGDARWKGSLPGGQVAGRVVGIAPTPEGNGYWLAGADGGVFSFGGSAYFGGLAGKPLSAPIVGIAASPTGKGYWLSGADGAVYAFGDATYLGGVGTTKLAGTVVGIVATPSGRGYWLAGSDGGVYGFGDAPYLGSLSGRPHAPIVGVARTTKGAGYWLAGADGGVFGFGEAGYFGSVSGSRLNRGIVAIAAGDGIAIPASPVAPAASTGFDISWPQCGGIRPAPPYGFGIVGVTNGHLFSVNPCLDEQWGWAIGYGSFAAVYVNSNAPTADELARFRTREAAFCGPNIGCALDQWGRLGARQAIVAAGRQPSPMWWLDVETGNEWLPDPAANAVILRAMIAELQTARKRVGVYSTARQWGIIAGSFAPGLPTWIPGAPPENPASYCTSHSFGGGSAWLVQSGDADFDTDVLCSAGTVHYREAFAAPAPMAVPEYDPARPPLANQVRRPGGVEEAVSAIRRTATGAADVAVLAAAGRQAGGAPSVVEWAMLVLFVLVMGSIGSVGSHGVAVRRRLALVISADEPTA
ncbi:MAG: hypothetical protein NVS3B21_02200 [Acidimicrobiales bacterium]